MINNINKISSILEVDKSLIVKASIKAAVLAAQRSAASANRKITIAGSVSCHCRDNKDGGWDIYPTEEGREERNFEEAAQELILAGVDCIFVELIHELDHSYICLEGVAKAAQTNECPVFLGISTILDNGVIRLFLGNSPVIVPFTKEILKLWIKVFTSRNVHLAGINIMHTKFKAIIPTIEIVKQAWDGPIGVYPDLCVFNEGDDQYGSIDSPSSEEIVAFCNECIQAGVSAIGGCCFVGLDTIELMSQTFNNKN